MVANTRGGHLLAAALLEGAIEGVAADYAMADRFATDFKYSRFGKTAAKPRDVSKLTGKKQLAVGAAQSPGIAVSDGVALADA